MDSLCFKAGIQGGLPSPISVAGGLDGRTHPAHFNALGRSDGGVSANASGISVDSSTPAAAPQKMSSSSTGFSFRYPLRSMWPLGGKGDAGVALDDAGVLGEDGERAAAEGAENESVGSGERWGNWVLRILQVRSLWPEQGKSGVEESEGEMKDDDAVNRRSSGCTSCDDAECGVCGVGEEEEEEVQFDRDSFSDLLRRVSLAEAKLYAQMSYLGYLAYSVSSIKVST